MLGLASDIMLLLFSSLAGGRTFALLLATWGIYLTALAIYRVHFSPIAKFPGPKLAAITTWYQGYYDIWRRGQYIWKIRDLHSKYGPIVRINPHEIHILDPEYINELYAGGSTRRDKYKWIARMLTGNTSLAATIPHDLHKMRRASLNTYFSKASVKRLEPMIKDITSGFLKRLDSAMMTREVLTMRMVYKALTSDVINSYAFGKSKNEMDMPDFNAPYQVGMERLSDVIYVLLQLGWLYPLLDMMPSWLASWTMPSLVVLRNAKKEWAMQIDQIRETQGGNIDSEGNIFYSLLNSSVLSDADRTTERLTEEAFVLLGAGLETTATTLMVITYHLLANPPILQKLRTELKEEIPDASTIPTFKQVESLPYLTAVVQEGLRMHSGSSTRQQRVSPIEDLVYTDTKTAEKWVIPAGTPVSMTPRLIHYLPQYFPDPNEFRPERWIENPRLDRYLLSFSKGSRICLGMNLAYQELYFVLASVFRKYDVYEETVEKQGPTLQLYDTVRERDIDMVCDLAVPVPEVGSEGLRIKVMG